MDDTHALTALMNLVTIAKARQATSTSMLRAHAQEAGMDADAIQAGLSLWASSTTGRLRALRGIEAGPRQAPDPAQALTAMPCACARLAGRQPLPCPQSTPIFP